MTNWVDHDLTITGPEVELRRFAVCWIKAKGERFPRWVEGRFDINEARPEGELFFSFDRLTPPKPDNWDEWVLARWGMKYVAVTAKIEPNDTEIKFSFDTAYSINWALYEELADLFPKLVIEGSICEWMMCFGGDVRVTDGQIQYNDKSAQMEAELAELAAKQDDEDYADLIKYVAGESNGIQPGTIGEQKALIAKKLVAEDAELLSPERRGELMGKISTIHNTPPHSTAANNPTSSSVADKEPHLGHEIGRNS